MIERVFALLAVAGCGGRASALAPAPPANEAATDPPPPIRQEQLTSHRSVETYCASLRALPPASRDGDAEPLQPACTTRQAWGTKATRFSPAGPFVEARVITIVTRRGDHGCALALLDRRRGWLIAESAIDTCDPKEEPNGEDASTGSMRREGDYLAITSVHRDTICGGCDDPIDVRIEKLTLCKADRCTAPIEIVHEGADIRFRTWKLTGDVLELSPWWNGHAADPPPRELFDAASRAERHLL